MTNSNAGFHVYYESFQKVCPIFMKKLRVLKKCLYLCFGLSC